jgi:Ankyrin repeat
VTIPSEHDHPIRLISADDPLAVAATEAVQAGDLERLERLLGKDPWLATARIGDWESHRTLLHAATDWPGHFPNGPAVVQRLVAAGADLNAHSRFGSHTETPLHWRQAATMSRCSMRCSMPEPILRQPGLCSAAAPPLPMLVDLATGLRPGGLWNEERKARLATRLHSGCWIELRRSSLRSRLQIPI